MERQLIRTGDQSPSFHVPALAENYHSQHGARRESEHVFIEQGLRSFPAGSEVHLLEVGFGTGLNAWLSAELAAAENYRLHYFALEKYPLEKREWLAYAEALGRAEDEIFPRLHSVAWEQWQEVSPFFRLFKHRGDLLDEQWLKDSFDLIYFDAFAPRVQPDLWEPAVFAALYKALKPGGILVTYCAKGDVRRGMQGAGFEVERRPGPPGKREMIWAMKASD